MATIPIYSALIVFPTLSFVCSARSVSSLMCVMCVRFDVRRPFRVAPNHMLANTPIISTLHLFFQIFLCAYVNKPKCLEFKDIKRQLSLFIITLFIYVCS